MSALQQGIVFSYLSAIKSIVFPQQIPSTEAVNVGTLEDFHYDKKYLSML